MDASGLEWMGWIGVEWNEWKKMGVDANGWELGRVDENGAECIEVE